MKSKTVFILFILLISKNLYSQQFKSGTLYFSDSTKLRGNIKYDFSKKKVKYQKEWRAKVKSFKKADIVKFDIDVNNRSVTYYLKKIKGLKDPIHIRPIVKGTINLYLLNTEDLLVTIIPQ